MFCKNCGNPLPEEQIRFCPNCGAEQPLEAAPAKEPSSAPTAEPVRTPEPAPVCDPALAAEHTVVAEPASAFAAPDAHAFGYEKPKKKKKLGLILGIALAAVAAAVAVALLFGGQIIGFYYRTFASPEEYLAYVEMKNFQRNMASLAADYEKYADVSDSVTMKSKLGFSVDEGLLELVFDGDGNAEEEARALAQWLESLQIELVSKQNGDLSSVEMNLSRKDEAILGLLMIMDAEKGEQYLSLPGLTDLFQMQEGYKSLDEERLEELLPDEELVERVMERYKAVLFDALPDFTLEEGSYPAEEGDVEAYLLSVTVTADDLEAVLEAILEEAEEDKELEEIYDSLLNVLDEMGLDKELFPDYDEITYLEEEDDDEEDDDEEEEDEWKIVFTDYVDGKNELIGRSFCIEDGAEAFDLRWMHYDEKVDFYFGDKNAALVAFGSAADKATRVEGEFRSKVMDETFTFLWIEEKESDKVSTATLEMELKLTDGEAPFQVFKLVLHRTLEDLKSEVECSLLGDGKKLFGLTAEVSLEKGADISLPAKDKILDEDDGILKDVSEDQILSLIEKLELPEEIMSGLMASPDDSLVRARVVSYRNGVTGAVTYYSGSLDVYSEGELTVMDVAAAVTTRVGGRFSAYYNQYTAFAGLEEENGYYWYAYVDGERVLNWNQVIDEDSLVEFRYELP